MKKRGIYITIIGLLLALFAGCSMKENTASTRFYHSFTAKYNVYFNGSQAYKQGMTALETGNKDNYLEQVPLYPIENKTSVGLGTSDFDRAIEKCQKAIKLHSIKRKPARKPGTKSAKEKLWLSHKEYNPFIHNAWMLMGKSQFNKGEFLQAAATFAYVARLYSTQPEVMTEAQIWLSHCYTELDWFYDAEEMLNKVNNDSLPRRFFADYAAARGNYLLRQKRYKEAVPYLVRVIDNESNSKQKAREYYLLGQVYQALGEQSKAFDAYGKASAQNPPFALDFNAKMKQTEVLAASSAKKSIKRLQRMARDSKNQEYLDQIYYALGNVYLSVKDTTQAILQYSKGAKEGTRNGVERGILLLKLGDLYWQRTEYVNAQSTYKDALGLIYKEHEGYEQLNKRSEVLDELIKQTSSVQLQDSLQHLATLSEEQRLKVATHIVDQLIKKERDEQKEKERMTLMQKREESMGEYNPTINAPKVPTTMMNSGDNLWYFYNAQLVAQGKSDFARKWGRRKLEDNWRRRNKTVLAITEFAETKYDNNSINKGDTLADNNQNASVDSIMDIKNPLYYLRQIPTTEQAMKESNEILMDALYNIAFIYKDKLEDNTLAQKTFARLYNQFPHFQHLDEVYYNLYLMNAQKKQNDEADKYKSRLIAEFPQSKYAITLSAPDFLYQSMHGKELEDSLYSQTYLAFKEGKFDEVTKNYQYASTQYAMGQHLPKFTFLNAVAQLKMGNQTGFLTTLKSIVEKYPKNEITDLAAHILKNVQEGKVLDKSASFGSIWNKRKIEKSEIITSNDTIVPKFIAEKNAPYLFILAYEEGKVDENSLLYEVAKYNFTNFIVRNFDLSFAKLNGAGMLQVKEFANLDEAYHYFRILYKEKEMASKLSGLKPIIISQQNYEILSKYYSFDDYQEFYQANFGKLPQVQLDGNTNNEVKRR